MGRREAAAVVASWKDAQGPKPSTRRCRPPGHATHRCAVLWRVQTAVKNQTRARRIVQLLAMLARGETIHFFKPCA
jgi:hypothetical protein